MNCRLDGEAYVTMSNGVHCDTGKQKCFKTKNGNEVAGHITKRLFNQS